jgi:hypothetical protein
MSKRVGAVTEMKRQKVDDLTRKREEAVKSREESIRIKSAVRLAEKERHLHRVKSRSGSQVETRRSQVETIIKQKEQKHH